MNRYLIPSLAIGTLVFSAGQAQAAQVAIDDFETGFQTVQLGGKGMTSSSTMNGLNQIIGGEREIKLTVEESEFGPNRGASVDVQNSLLTVSNDAGIESETVITWDGPGKSGLNADLTGGGMNGVFSLDIVSVDLQALVTLAVTDSGGDTASLSKAALSEGSAVFNFNTFNNAMDTDFSDVESISLTVGGPQEVDFAADSLVTTVAPVPEPLTILGSGLALGFGALFKTKYSRKHQKAQHKN
ncbi:PEP-CTERM sorting domain-containing protein [Coleofasciculus sp.]|uniref:PEP-CTERM sorting domain-containing protein n=1 Tax=Coleofasciculus sp. TaxID=3100458 RepID=UPI0039F770CB